VNLHGTGGWGLGLGLAARCPERSQQPVPSPSPQPPITVPVPVSPHAGVPRTPLSASSPRGHSGTSRTTALAFVP
jgi:hypothetical protein